GAVGRAQVGGDHAVGGDADLQMPAGDAGVVDDDVCLAAAADHGDGAGAQVALPVDVHDRVAGAAAGGRGRGHRAAPGGRPDAEPPGLEVGDLGELHFHRPHENVLLTGGVVRGRVCHLLGLDLLSPVLHLLIVLGGKLHDERV